MTTDEKSITLKWATLVSISVYVVGVTTWSANLSTRVSALEDEQKSFAKVIDKLDDADLVLAKDNTASKVALAKITSQLTSIETTLLEVRAKLFK